MGEKILPDGLQGFWSGAPASGSPPSPRPSAASLPLLEMAPLDERAQPGFCQPTFRPQPSVFTPGRGVLPAEGRIKGESCRAVTLAGRLTLSVSDWCWHQSGCGENPISSPRLSKC